MNRAFNAKPDPHFKAMKLREAFHVDSMHPAHPNVRVNFLERLWVRCDSKSLARGCCSAEL